jgi:hypothetical protein
MSTNHPLLAAYVPSDSDPFDAVKAAHLLNRAGFGGTPEEVDRVLKLGPQAAVDWLMDFPDAPAEEEGNDQPDLSGIAGLPDTFREQQLLYAGKTADEKKVLQQQFMAANHQAVQATIYWWLKRMASTPYPLQEKLTLFWHGHFTTSAKDERSALLMWNQNELLRKSAAGNFETFVRAISRDPAMLDYLNNNQNRKAHPNENYARELMELFTLGIGNYTEDDIKQAARAFTGWMHDGDEFVFRLAQHDTGSKTFFGKTGNFDGDDIITMILAHPACPKFISGELFKYFAYDNADEGLSQAMGDVLLAGKYEMRPLLRTILTSKAFYSDQSIGVQIKSPVQLVVGTIRLLKMNPPPEQSLISSLTQMGQLPMMPPNVRGWPGGAMWINTSTLFIRYNTGIFLAGGDVPEISAVKRNGQDGREITNIKPVPFAPTASGAAADVVDRWVNQLIQRPIDPSQKAVLVDALGTTPDRPDSVRKLVQLIFSMPEYQLC